MLLESLSPYDINQLRVKKYFLIPMKMITRDLNGMQIAMTRKFHVERCERTEQY